MPGVTVTVRSPDTNAMRLTVSDTEGRYRIPTLPVGVYEVSAEQSGFSKYQQSGITIAVNQTAVVDSTMQAGARHLIPGLLK
jgi:carboxypeptidase family protein